MVDKEVEHYFSALNDDNHFNDLRHSDIVRFSCSTCANVWESTKKTYLLTPKCKRCAKIKALKNNDVTLQFPEILKYTNVDISLESHSSTKKILAQCPDCDTWFQKSIKGFVKDFTNKVNPCGKCNPQHRVRNGIIFKKNFPHFEKSLVSYADGGLIEEDIPVNTLDKFVWLKECGHKDVLTPQRFLQNPKLCTSCYKVSRSVVRTEGEGVSEPRFLLDSEICSTCLKTVSIKRADREYIKACGDFVCKRCRESSRVAQNSLREKIEGWEKVYWSPNNEADLDALTSASAFRAEWVCFKNGHSFERFIYASNDNCPLCSTSTIEQTVGKMLEGYSGEILRNDRTLIAPREVDFYLPEVNIAIEVNGLFWHTESKVGKKRHYEKFIACREKGVQLLTLWEDDILNNEDIIKRFIAYKLGFAQVSRVNARSTVAACISSSEANEFLDRFHIQGRSRAGLHYGLYAEDMLVAVSSFTKKGDTVVELTRFATSDIVRGGFSKLIKKFTSDNPDVEIVQTFSDNAVSNGDVYFKNGFTQVADIQPDYSYLAQHRRVHKFNYRKARFKKDSSLVFEENLSESQLAAMNGIERIWDCGKVKWEMKLKKLTVAS